MKTMKFLITAFVLALLAITTAKAFSWLIAGWCAICFLTGIALVVMWRMKV